MVIFLCFSFFIFFLGQNFYVLFIFHSLFFFVTRRPARTHAEERRGGGGVRVVKVDFYILKKLNLQDRGESPLLLLLFTTKF